jgi:hypothetical protein
MGPSILLLVSDQSWVLEALTGRGDPRARA